MIGGATGCRGAATSPLYASERPNGPPGKLPARRREHVLMDDNDPLAHGFLETYTINRWYETKDVTRYRAVCPEPPHRHVMGLLTGIMPLPNMRPKIGFRLIGQNPKNNAITQYDKRRKAQVWNATGSAPNAGSQCCPASRRTMQPDAKPTGSDALIRNISGHLHPPLQK